MGWIGIIIAGIIVGLLGKFVAPGSRDDIPIWLTVICGIVGVVIGYALMGTTDGPDWLRWIVSIILAAVLVMVAATITAKRGAKA